jgi:four helix bundle protein
MKNDLEHRTKLFALEIINLVGSLAKGKASDVLGYQLLKSGASVGANYREARRAQSSADFIHKLAICEKEAAETEYWLELLLDSQMVTPDIIAPVIGEARELLAILVSSAKTAKSRA